MVFLSSCKTYVLPPLLPICALKSFFKKNFPIGPVFKESFVFQTTYLKVIYFVILAENMYMCQLELLISTSHPVGPQSECSMLAMQLCQEETNPWFPYPPSQLKGLQGKWRAVALVHLPHLPWGKQRSEVTCSQGHIYLVA